MALLAIDIGTTSAKVAAYSRDGIQLSMRTWEYIRPQGSTEYDGTEIWLHVQEMIPAAVRACGEPIQAIGVCSQGEAIAPIGADGEPLYPFLQNTDMRGKPYIAALTEEQRERVRRVNLLAPHPRYGLAKMLCIQSQRPDIVQKLWKYMLFQDFIVYKLTGESFSDHSIATRTNAYNHGKQCFDTQILSWAGLTAEHMPALKPTGSIAGNLSGKLASALHLTPGIPVVLCGHDCIPENLCSGVVAPGIASLGCGTAEGVGVLIPHKDLEQSQVVSANLGCERFPIPECDLLFGFNANSGSVAKWYRDTFGGGMGYEGLDRAMPEAPTELLAIPHFSGSSTPDFRGSSKASILGLTYSHTPGHVYKALLEGTAYEMRYILACMRSAGVAATQLRASGGGAKSEAWLRIKADILGLPIYPLKNKDATLGGCAMLAGWAIGLYDSLENAAKHYVSVAEPIEPDGMRAQHYAELYAKYKEARHFFQAFWSEVG